MLRTLVALTAGLLLAVASCSSNNTTPSPSDSPTANVLPPIPVNGAKPITVGVGTTLNVITEGVTKVSTNNDKVLDISQPKDDGSATFNAGAVAIAEGTATLDVFKGDKKLYATKITVVAATPSGNPEGLQ